MAVVILGNTNQFREHGLVRDAVEARGAETFLIEIQDWPADGSIEFTLESDTCTIGETIPFDDVTGVFSMLQSVFQEYDRGYEWFDEKPERVAYNQLREWQRMTHSLLEVFESYGAKAAVSPVARYWDIHRPAMLDLYDRNGLPVPETTFTNDPDRVNRFMERHETAIVHGVNGGTPELVRYSELSQDRLDRLAAAPIKLQEFVPGVDARGFVVDGEFAGMVRYEHESDAVSFKRPEVVDEEIESVAMDPERELREAVVTAGDLSPSAYATVDVRVTDDGDFTILESNTPGRFAGHDLAGSTAVASKLATFLTES